MVLFVASCFGVLGPHTATDALCDGAICFQCGAPVLNGAAGGVCFWQSPPAQYGLLAGVLATLGTVFFYAWRLRGTSNAHRVMAVHLTIPLVFILLSGMGIGVSFDALLAWMLRS